jgi:hypothetical protein
LRQLLFSLDSFGHHFQAQITSEHYYASDNLKILIAEPHPANERPLMAVTANYWLKSHAALRERLRASLR